MIIIENEERNQEPVIYIPGTNHRIIIANSIVADRNRWIGSHSYDNDSKYQFRAIADFKTTESHHFALEINWFDNAINGVGEKSAKIILFVEPFSFFFFLILSFYLLLPTPSPPPPPSPRYKSQPSGRDEKKNSSGSMNQSTESLAH